MKYMYQNISNEVRRYAGVAGTWKHVVPGDVFETERKQTSPFFKEVTEDMFKDVEKVEEAQAVEEEPKKKSKKKKYFKKINEE